MATNAEIGSLATTLDELTRRVRSLSGALRRLRKLAEPQ